VTRRVRFPAAGILAVSLAAYPHPAAGDPSTSDRAKLRVEIEGLGGVLAGLVSTQSLEGTLVKQNVDSMLTIYQDRKEDTLTAARIRRLHGRAPEEIRKALEPFGFYRPQIEASLERDGEQWVARYRIDPGPPVPLETVRVAVTGEGRFDWGFRRNMEDFPLEKGDTLVHPLYEAGKAAFLETAARLGYLDGKFTESQVRVDLETYSASIDLEYTTGPRYFFGPVSFQQDFLDPDLLQDYVSWKQGDPLNQEEMLNLQNALSSTSYFRRVEVTAAREETEGLEVPIFVDLLPSKPRRYKLGIGYGTDTGIRGTVDVQFRRINRHGHHAGVTLLGSELEQSASARYVIPGASPRTDAWTFTLGWARLAPTTSTSRTAFAASDYAFGAGRWRHSVSLAYSRDVFTVGLDSGTALLLTPAVNSTLVVADDRIDTRRGYRLHVQVAGASASVGSSASFARALVSAKGILSISSKDRLIGRAALGAMTTSDFHALPPRVRFFAGGDTSVRGYKYESLGEKDAAGNVIGGRRLQVGSIEFEHRFLPKWGAAVFFDAGNALDEFTTDLARGVGIGVRWLSPVGPVRVDGAYALGPPHGVRLVINIGPDL
jgi:translocation and assembly module TamA